MGDKKRAEAREQRARTKGTLRGVCIAFERHHDWLCTFIDKESGRQIGPVRHYGDPGSDGDRRRGRWLRTQDDVHALNFAISQGRGSLSLLLSEDQYRKPTS